MNLNNFPGAGVDDQLIIEEENEKRKLEQIYMVAGEEKKTKNAQILKDQILKMLKKTEIAQ